VDIVNDVVPQLIQHGRVIRPHLGVTYYTDENTLRRAGIRGVLILSVAQGSGAEAAGLRGTRRTQTGNLILGDIIQKIDQKVIADSDDLLDALEHHEVGDMVEIIFERDGGIGTAKVRLQAPPR